MMQSIPTRIVDSSGNPFTVEVPQPVLAQMGRKARASIDAARDTTEFARHWANADQLDADSSHRKDVRHKLMHRSRYEADSNGYYDGILSTHCNMTIGVGPKLRMLTKNKNFNQLVEREFATWADRIQLRRKLWCMYHAYLMDGEAFAVMQSNPSLPGPVQLDLMLIEADQVQTPYIPIQDRGKIDGITFDAFNNILYYDVLEQHPGSMNHVLLNLEPVKVPAPYMLHLFPMKRPGVHRGKPAMTSTLNLGATSRRVREATVAKVETQADFTVLLKSLYPANELDEPEAMDAFEIEKRMAVTLPNSVEAQQLKNDTPTANYGEFNRLQVSELGRPISMPVNLGLCDSSTYSFASGKLDTICYFGGVEVDRTDINLLLLDRIFAEWFREWRLTGDQADMGPAHRFDWPAKPIIDDRAEAGATDTRLKNGSITLRQVYSNQGLDLEDELLVMAEDYFGDSSEENVNKMREVLLYTHFPAAKPEPAPAAPATEQSAMASLTRQLKRLEAQLAELEITG